MDRLECQTTVRDLRAASISLPTSIDETYNDAMTRIKNQVPEYSKLAMSALSWISNTLWPLKWNELQYALAVRHGDKKMDEEALVDKTLLISVSAGLITLDAQSGTVRLAHFTVEEYFKREKQAWFPNADSQIAETCLIYLSFDIFKTGPCSSPDEVRTRLRQNCFLKYASQNWGHHTLRADEHIDEDIAMHFLKNDQMVSCCIQAKPNFSSTFWRLWRVRGKPIVKKVQSSGLHFAAELGLLSVFKKLLECHYDVHSKDYMGRTPLKLAIIEGHVEIAKFLVDQDDVSAESRDEHGRTLLSWAALAGHAEIVKLLLARDDVIADSRDIISCAPLSYAASAGHAEIVKLLLARDDVIADSWNTSSRTPLSYAASQGHTEIVKLLVARDDVVADSQDNDGRTPLCFAVIRGHEAVVKLLLDRNDVVADSQDNDGRTPLSHAAQKGDVAVVKLLLDRGDLVVDSRDNFGATPLSYAARFGNIAVVKLLLDLDDVVVDSRDDGGRTPLSYAAGEGSEAVVKLLLDRDDVSADSRSSDGRTPLSYAVRDSREAVVKFLLDRDDVAVLSQDNDGQTPLDYAIIEEPLYGDAVVQLLENKIRTLRAESTRGERWGG